MSKRDDDWARHYDQLLWLSTSIFIIAIVQLAAASCSCINIEMGLLGLLITCSLLFFAVSFRKYKHPHMTGGQKPELPQWKIYTLLMFLIGLYWLYYIQKIIGFGIIWGWVGLFWVSIVVILYDKGRYNKTT